LLSRLLFCRLSSDIEDQAEDKMNDYTIPCRQVGRRPKAKDILERQHAAHRRNGA
jgi:hypothetical protein